MGCGERVRQVYTPLPEYMSLYPRLLIGYFKIFHRTDEDDDAIYTYIPRDVQRHGFPRRLLKPLKLVITIIMWTRFFFFVYLCVQAEQIIRGLSFISIGSNDYAEFVPKQLHSFYTFKVPTAHYWFDVKC